MAHSIDQLIESLAITITEARWHFQVWEALQEARSDEASLEAMNRYKEFFVPTMSAHFESTIVACYQLLETRDDTVSFSTLKKALKDIEKRDLDQEQPMAGIQRDIHPIWIKIARLRNQAVGHVSSEKPQSEIFAQADLKPQDIWTFIDLSIRLHQGITYPRSQTIEGFNINGKPATAHLIKMLCTHR